MARLHNLTIKPHRVPRKSRKEKPLAIAEYIITSCELCGTELAMTIPYDGEPVRCAACDHPRPRFEVGEDVIAFDDVE